MMDMKNVPESKRRGPFEIDVRKEVYKNKWISVHEYQVHQDGGEKGLFGILTMPNGSAVVTLDDQNRVYLGKEFRFAINHASYEVPGGAIDAGETPLDAAKRELEEEVGFRAKQWTNLGYIDPYTGIVESKNHMFLAQDLEDVGANTDSWERIECIRIPLSEAVDMVLRGEITHGASCVALLMTARKLGV